MGKDQGVSKAQNKFSQQWTSKKLLMKIVCICINGCIDKNIHQYQENAINKFKREENCTAPQDSIQHIVDEPRFQQYHNDHL